jgi:hypothetical protein
LDAGKDVKMVTSQVAQNYVWESRDTLVTDLAFETLKGITTKMVVACDYSIDFF